MVIEMLACAMRLDRDRIAAGEMREWELMKAAQSA